MKRIVLGAAAAFALTAAAFSGSAQAQCWWNGWNWSCAAPPATAYQPYGTTYGYAAPVYPGYYGYSYSDQYTGYKPAWDPSFSGPRPSSGAGR